MKILLGGIPLGCDNIGDEAIIAGVVKMLKESLPGVELTVATKDAATAQRLGVGTCPLFGFEGAGLSLFRDVARKHDAYIWCGATGLSDYPNSALDIVEAALDEELKVYIWGVGMNDALNPVFFKAQGRRRKILSALGLAGTYEAMLHLRLKRRIAKLLPRCSGVWLRDMQSAAALARLGYPNARITADSAILLAPETRSLASSKSATLGLCISSQNRVKDLSGLCHMLDAVRKSGAKVIGIPMNPVTDRALMESLGVECSKGATPESVMSDAANCALVLTSRLHLLILAANAGTPGLGIARGSKLANWLANFGENVLGSVDDCDWSETTRIVLERLAHFGDWPKRRDSAYARLLSRLDKARGELVRSLTANQENMI